MHQRCCNPNHTFFHRYGGRGIQICPEWHRSNPGGFNNFIRDMGHRLAGESIDRIDNDGNYEPTNCRWVLKTKQQSNRSDAIFISAFGESKRLLDWLKDSRCQANVNTLRLRLKSGWAPERAISLPSTFIEQKAYCPCCSREYLRIKEWQRFCSLSCRKKTARRVSRKDDQDILVMKVISDREMEENDL